MHVTGSALSVRLRNRCAHTIPTRRCCREADPSLPPFGGVHSGVRRPELRTRVPAGHPMPSTACRKDRPVNP
jgi:hypothetical protein